MNELINALWPVLIVGLAVWAILNFIKPPEAVKQLIVGVSAVGLLLYVLKLVSMIGVP